MIVTIAECHVRWLRWKHASSLALDASGQPRRARTKVRLSASFVSIGLLLTSSRPAGGEKEAGVRLESRLLADCVGRLVMTPFISRGAGIASTGFLERAGAGPVAGGAVAGAWLQTVSPISRTHAPLYGTAMMRPDLARAPPAHEKLAEPIDWPMRESALVVGSNSSTVELRHGMP